MTGLLQILNKAIFAVGLVLINCVFWKAWFIKKGGRNTTTMQWILVVMISLCWCKVDAIIDVVIVIVIKHLYSATQNRGAPDPSYQVP